jgi:hypothetical protein
MTIEANVDVLFTDAGEIEHHEVSVFELGDFDARKKRENPIERGDSSAPRPPQLVEPGAMVS